MGTNKQSNNNEIDIQTDKDEIIRKASIKVRDIMRKVNDKNSYQVNNKNQGEEESNIRPSIKLKDHISYINHPKNQINLGE